VVSRHEAGINRHETHNCMRRCTSVRRYVCRRSSCMRRRMCKRNSCMQSRFSSMRDRQDGCNRHGRRGLASGRPALATPARLSQPSGIWKTVRWSCIGSQTVSTQSRTSRSTPRSIFIQRQHATGLSKMNLTSLRPISSGKWQQWHGCRGRRRQRSCLIEG
jgi:hypothetical protein